RACGSGCGITSTSGSACARSEQAMTRQGGAHTMKWSLLLLSVIALVLSPGLTLSQSKTTTEPSAAKAKDTGGGGHFMKDSWITTKTKTKLIADGRTKARRITVDTTDGVVSVAGKVAGSRVKKRAGDVTRQIPGVKMVRNELR